MVNLTRPKIPSPYGEGEGSRAPPSRAVIMTLASVLGLWRRTVGVDHEPCITPIPTFPPQGGRRLRVCTLSQEELRLKARGFHHPRRRQYIHPSFLPSLYKKDEFPGKYVCSMMDSLITLIKPYLTLFSAPVFAFYAGEARSPLADEME